MKKIKILTISLLVIMALLLSLPLVSCSDNEPASTKITSAEIKDEKITVKATLDQTYAENNSDKKIYLLSLSSMSADKSLLGAEMVAESKAKGKMTFKFSLYSNSGESRIASAFVLAERIGEGYSAITDPYYISNPDIEAEKNNGGNSPSSIKGLMTEDVYGAEMLGASQILIEARMDKLILEEYHEDAVKFNYDGVSYFYNSSEVEKLDKLVLDGDRLGMRIYIRTILSYDEPEKGDDDYTEPPEFLYCNGAKGAESYLPDVSNKMTVRYIKAFYAFLASRYPVSDFIIGEQVNNYNKHCNAGKVTSEEFEVLYSFWARTAYQTVKSVNSEASITIPVDNAWRVYESVSRIGANAFLLHFSDSTKRGGDYEYGIALNLGEGSDLPALLSGEGYDYSNIGVTNLSELKKFRDSTEMRYKSESRSFIIDGLSLSNTISEKNRAAYYTFAYYSASENGLDAFFCSSNVYASEYTRSDMYYSILMCGSNLNSQLSAYTQKLPEVHVPTFNDHISKNLTYSQSAKLSISESVARNKKALPLTIDSFAMGGGVYNLQGKIKEDNNGINISWLVDSDPSLGTGAICAKNVPAKDIISSGYIGITLESDTAPTIALMILNETDTSPKHMYVGEIQTVNGLTTYYFDISGFVKDIKSSDTLTIAICILQDGDENESIEIHEIALYGSSGSGIEAIVIIIVVSVIVLALIALIVLLVVKRRKKDMHTSSYDEQNGD